jgi:hypothetical protein
MRRNNKIKIAKDILLKILDSSLGNMQYFCDLRSYHGAPFEGGREYIAAIKNAKERKYLKDELRRLKRNKFIEERKTGNRLVLALTAKGRQAALRHRILEIKKINKDKFCVVVFDIPESERKIRDFFRNFLKEAGFIRLQQSVWVSNKDTAEYIIDLVRSASAEKWVSVIEAGKISNFAIKNKR